MNTRKKADIRQIRSPESLKRKSKGNVQEAIVKTQMHFAQRHGGAEKVKMKKSKGKE